MSSLERAFEESQTNQVNYYSSGKTVGIYVYVNGEKQLFTLESELREQILHKLEVGGYERLLADGQEWISLSDAKNAVTDQAIRGK